MALDYALLVSLNEKPSSGYELARRFERSIGYFWYASHQQIYRVLARMESAGWVDAVIHPGETAPDRKVFTVTDAGNAEMLRWLMEAEEPAGLRDTLMIKLRGSVFSDPAKLIPELERHRAIHQERLENYRQIEQRDFGGVLDKQRAVQYQILKLGIQYELEKFNWCAETLALIRSFHPSTKESDT